MNRTWLPVSVVFGTSSLLLMDSAIKGSAILMLAAFAVLLLRRDSAATRHLVWLVAIVGMLVVPVFSAMLPQWQVLPAWMAFSQEQPVVELSTPSVAIPSPTRVRVPAPVRPFENEQPSATVDRPLVNVAVSPPSAIDEPVPANFAPTPTAPLRTWSNALPLAWAIGFSVLILRLMAARWMLNSSERRARVPGQTRFPGDGRTAEELDSDAAIVAAFEDARRQLGIRQQVRLLIHTGPTIPVVWGIVRLRLLLPAAARQWSGEQLRSVLLHELAHIRRHDTIVQLLAQVACALHWFNPLVWFAAWRLHVERERACDDLVLAHGVRASAYAEHLLNVATQLAPARWTSGCGLGMARKSSLEGRLLAVLSEKLNRRGVTTALAALALILGAGIAIPVAMLRAADEKWNPPQVVHMITNDFSAYCVHDGKDAAFVITYHGDFGSATESSSNAKTRTWTNSGTLTAKKPGIALGFHGTHTSPDKIVLSTTPAEGRDLSRPAPAPLEFGQKEYDLAQGRVFVLSESGAVRQLDIPNPLVTDHPSAKKLAALIAAIPPQVREDIVPPSSPQPKHKDARALFEIWQRHARANGDIPGALIGELAAAVKTFIGYNPTWETVPKLNEILPRLDATHDWTPADAIALLDEVAAVQDSPLMGAAEKATRGTIRNGKALPKKFADAAWGDAQPNGLRAAWVLEPGAVEHRIGAALKARLLVQNPGQVPVMVHVPTWHQGWVKATDAKGTEVEVSGISWTTIAQLVPVRLGPGEFIEIYMPGIGIGPRAGMGPWAGPRVGSNVLAKPGDELTLTHGLVPLDGSDVGIREDDPHVAGPGWWLAHIKTRLNRELPLPDDAAERTRLLDRAVRELFATAPTAEETAAFVADKTPDALDALAKRLASRVDVVSFSGKLPTAPAKFRVLAADVNADKLPRVVLGPGEYPLPSATAFRGDATLKIVGRPVGDRRTNDAQLLFEATEFTGALPPDPHKLEVPDGWGTWAIVCRPDSDCFYLLSKGTVRKIDYIKPRNVTDTPANDLPAEFRDEVKRQLDIHGVSEEAQTEIFQTAAASANDSPRTDEARPQPRHEYAQALFKKWQANARTDGKIPGALIGHVAEQVENFISRYPDNEKTPALSALRPRFDTSHDWTPADVVALLDDVTAVTTAPVSWADGPMEFSEMRSVQGGQPLPIELENAAWGEPAANGLRAAWLLEPQADQYSVHTVLRSRVLFHNTGDEPVVFRTEIWHQDDKHSARDANGAAIAVGGTWYTGVTPMVTIRLEPGEFVEVRGHGIAIGAGEYVEERSTGSVGAWIEAKVGDDVRFSSIVDASTEGWTRPNDPKDPAELWQLVVRERVEREAPLSGAAADRELLLVRVIRDLFGIFPTAEEFTAFTADEAPDALAKLTTRLQVKQRSEPFVGKLPTGEITFRVVAADPNAAKAPRTATGPGRYVLGDGVHLLVTQTTSGGQRTNKAKIVFLSPDPKVASPHKPYEIDLADTYAFVWERGAQKLWVTDISEGGKIPIWMAPGGDLPGPQKVMLRAFDLANPGDVEQTHVSTSENGGGWSWAKLMPQAFQAPVIQALGEKGKRLLDFAQQPEAPQQPDAPQPKEERTSSPSRS